MRSFDGFRVGEKMSATCSISEREVDAYLELARTRNTLLGSQPGGRIVPGRAVLARMEGEFTKLGQICGNTLIFVGTDGDPGWKGRCTRLIRPLHAGETLRITFTISGKEDAGGGFGRISVDFEGRNADGETVAVARRNIYLIGKASQDGLRRLQGNSTL